MGSQHSRMLWILLHVPSISPTSDTWPRISHFPVGNPVTNPFPHARVDNPGGNVPEALSDLFYSALFMTHSLTKSLLRAGHQRTWGFEEGERVLAWKTVGAGIKNMWEKQQQKKLCGSQEQSRSRERVRMFILTLAGSSPPAICPWEGSVLNQPPTHISFLLPCNPQSWQTESAIHMSVQFRVCFLCIKWGRS